MNLVHIWEQHKYSWQKLCCLFGGSEKESEKIIRRLKEFGILKAVRSHIEEFDLSEMEDTDEVIAELSSSADCDYVFRFVGVLVVGRHVLLCYPKYMPPSDQPSKQQSEQFRKVIRVIEKYDRDHPNVLIFQEESGTASFNLLGILLFLLRDYGENGLIYKTEDPREINGLGEIDWERTISGELPVLKQNRLYYMQLHTRRKTADLNDYFTLLHEWVLTAASHELKETGLLDLFGLNEVRLSEARRDDFGEPAYILYRLEKELNVSFHTRKQHVLQAIHAFIGNGKSLLDTDCYSLYGTNAFHVIWENVCSEILDNQLHKMLGELSLPLKPGYKQKAELISLIEKPVWTKTGKEAADTLIPDIVTISKKDGQYMFAIYDAKYYVPVLDAGKQLTGQPGIESVAKQYLYRLAFQKFIKDHDIQSVENCFLFPAENGFEESGGLNECGTVELNFLKDLCPEGIKVIFLSADKAYDLYLSGKRLRTNP